MTPLCQTERLIIRPFTLADTEFIIRLLNQASFIRYIADKHVRDQKDAENYLRQGPLASYHTHGFGLNLVAQRSDNTAIGMCGLLTRAELDKPDLGYAMLSEYCGQGYALEAATAVLKHTMTNHSLETVIAVTLPNNLNSNRLLMRLGFALIDTTQLYELENNLYQYQR
ncbi:GNAT family N-acetyltransferase [Shewanella sp. NIFS-20-20]|uniref:GNAT family N-acetyltransferase n=1 Tax=Shewanella sp. NIFS-20-20 TaxID=2853806 RepID=UPI001C44578A|nr:GNAT family N-acetyltransferase [Shewanella sp. NIFS-20-20]MBV7315320.1 GNAT family N-acetyltransferase [Shewanella sp. NIFS-20-20]